MEESKAQLDKMTYTVGTRNSNEWYTPEKYIELVRKSFITQTIEFDPFSSAKANTIVKATRFLTEADDAFTTDWQYRRNVFINPPYSAGLCLKSVNMFIDKYDDGKFFEGIVLVNNATEVKWFQRMLREGTALCLVDHRIAYWNDDFKRISGNPRGQAFFYFGPDGSMFKEQMSTIGKVMYLK